MKKAAVIYPLLYHARTHRFYLSRLQDDNSRKGDVTVVVGNNDNGDVMFEKHPHKEFIVSRKDLISLFAKSDVYKKVASMLPQFTLRRGKRGTAGYKPARQARKIKASWKLLKRAMCKCLHFPNAPNVCSCKICTLAEQMLFVYHQKRTGWHQEKGERKATDASPAKRSCDKCNGACYADMPYRQYSSSPRVAISTLTCEGEDQKHLGIPAVDDNDRVVGVPPGDLAMCLRKFCPRLEEDALAPKQIPAAALKIASTVLMFAPACRSLVHPPVKCVLGECAKGKCGISNKFSHVNGGRPIEFMQNFKPKELYFTCPVEAGTPRDTMSWNKWCKVPTGIDEFGDVEHLEQWAPVTGTRRQFLYELQEAVEVYISHKHHVRTFNWNWKRAEHKLLVEYGTTGKVPEGGVPAMGGCDWASTVDHQRAFTMTCAYPQRSQLFVAVIAHSPYMAQVAEIPDTHKRQRKGLNKKGITQKLQYKVSVLYSHHKKKPSAALASQMCIDFLKVLNTGFVPSDSEAEYVEGGTRLPGGTPAARAKPLSFGITNRVTPMPSATKPIKQWWRRRDRCAAQFQGARSFKGVQDFERKCGVNLKDTSPPAMEGKWLHDGLGNRVARVAEENSFYPSDKTWKPDLRDFMLFVASKMLKPCNASNFQQGRWGPTEYFHALYPESAFPETTPEVASWPGSDDMHFFTGKYNKTSDDELIRRKKLCVCDPCFEGARTRARGCDTSDLFSPPSFSSTRFVTGKCWNCRSNAKDRCLWYGPRGKLLLATVLASPCCVFPQCVSPHVCRAKALS